MEHSSIGILHNRKGLGKTTLSLGVTTCLHGENGLVHGVIPFPVLKASIKVEGLPSPYYLSVSSKELCIMNLAV